MLRRLNIRDFVLVDRLELEFDAGFGVLTGETGAGKSILVDALAFVLGERADAGLVRLESRRLVVLSTGRMLVRAISMVFDAWLRKGRQDAGRQGGRYSKVI